MNLTKRGYIASSVVGGALIIGASMVPSALASNDKGTSPCVMMRGPGDSSKCVRFNSTGTFGKKWIIDQLDVQPNLWNECLFTKKHGYLFIACFDTNKRYVFKVVK